MAETDDFQRKSAFLQIAVTIIATLGSVLIAVGLSQQNTANILEMSSNIVNNTNTSDVFKDQAGKIMDTATNTIYSGIIVILIGLFLGIIFLWKKRENDNNKSS